MNKALQKFTDYIEQCTFQYSGILEEWVFLRVKFSKNNLYLLSENIKTKAMIN